ncbi:helix-turn-helix domain-containing protein [uncultured Alsobacter sp.]|uniref:IclR family transcriptional regulator n=1 Tax=uncultured Alsobacter sp. TaxID=1748258 RepID=UPI0025CEA4BD|nr:helix-turn-helix domain-containing protein [uncultured Alsobacter sp.]
MSAIENEAPEGNTDGTQAIRRAAAILRRIGQGDPQGVGLSAITDTVKLPRSTAHRILKCLVEEDLVRHDAERRRYMVGRLTYELSLAVTPDTLDIGRWRVAVDRVAQRTGVTSYLLGRSGIEATCLLKTDGSAVIRVIPVEIGQRRLLGVGAGSTALLAALDPETTERIIRTIAPHLEGHANLNEATVRRLVAETRATGFTVSRSNVVREAIGIGMAIPAKAGHPTLALSIAGLASQADDTVVDRWKQIIREEIEAVLQT